KALVRDSLEWQLEKAVLGTNALEQKGELRVNMNPALATYNQLLYAEYTIAAAGTQAVDFYGPWISPAQESVTATKLLGFQMVVTGNSTLKVEPNASAGLAWPMKGTAPYVELKPATGIAVWKHFDGTHQAVSSTARQWLLTNTGAAALTVKLAA